MPIKSILILTPGYLPLLGGMEQQCYLLATEFTRLGHSVTVLTELTEPSFEKFELRPEATVHRMSTGSRSTLTYFRLCISITKHLIRHKYSFIIIRTLTFPAIVVGLLKLLRIVTCPTFVTAETGGENDDIISIKDYPFFHLLKFLISQNSFLNSINSTNTQHYHDLNFPINKLVSISNGIDTRMYSKFNYPKRVEAFLFLGQMRNEKGIRELLAAFKNCLQDNPRIQLFLAGDGPERSLLESFISKNKMNKSIHYLGRIGQDRLDWFFGLGECLVLPSYSEGMPLVIMEAVARKRVIISTNVGNVYRLLGAQVFKCEISDSISLARAMNNVLKSRSFNLDYEQVIKDIDISRTANTLLTLLSPITRD